MIRRMAMLGLLGLATPFGAPALASDAPTGANAEIVEVVVTGIGIDADAALKNGWAAAISQVVGTMVSSETVVQNKALIKDEIISHSRGYVDKYDEIERRTVDGLVEIDLRVFVTKVPLRTRLVDLQLVKQEVAGHSIAASIQTQLQQASDSRTVLARAFEPFTNQVTRAELVGEPQVRVSGTQAALHFQVKVAIDGEQWKAATVALKDALDEMAVSKKAVMGRYGDVVSCKGADYGIRSESGEYANVCVVVLSPRVRSLNVETMMTASAAGTQYMVRTGDLPDALPVGNHEIWLQLKDADGDIVVADVKKECLRRNDRKPTCPGNGPRPDATTGVTLSGNRWDRQNIAFIGEVASEYFIEPMNLDLDLAMTAVDAARVVTSELSLQYVAPEE